MCGIAGASRNLLGSDPQSLLASMNQVMFHRGPDMGEIFCDQHMGLCHRRLSIIDLSEDGRQPMQFCDGRYTIVFNGEIYNFLDLRQDLTQKGYSFRSRTDTEVLLALYADCGADMLQKIRGMFAFAIWDAEEKVLFAARDRIGKKPLYYYFRNDQCAFASELKSLLELSAIPRDIDFTAVVDYLHYLYIPHPKSIYKDIHKLEPGHYFIFKDKELTVRQYWDVDFSQPFSQPLPEIIAGLYDTIDDAVRCRLMADVPLGAFLSGGVDSSGIVALMSRALDDPVTTCSIGFEDKAANEAHYAKEFAAQLGTRHHEHYIANEPAEIVERLIWHCDEPFADSSMVPTYYVSQMARRNVTVALSGDGGDENFAGYAKYGIDRIENMTRERVPHFLLRSATGLPNRPSLLRKLRSLSRSALMPPAEAFYVTNTFISPEQFRELIVPELAQEVREYDPSHHLQRYYEAANGPDHLSRILYADLKLYLPGDILVKVDRMSMANSLEVRSPLLDHKVIEYAARIPSCYKMRGGDKKYILKRAFQDLVGTEVLNRKKHGFEVPLHRWFRHELRDMAETALFEGSALNGFVNPRGLQRIWDEHQGGQMQHGTLLWTMFILSLWMKKNGV